MATPLTPQASSAARTAAVSRAALAAGASPGAITAFNWARWEQIVRDTRRKELWRMAIKKVAGSKTHIWSSEDANADTARVTCPDRLVYDYKFGGSRTGRLTAMQVSLMQQQANARMASIVSHAADAMQYSLISFWHKRIEQYMRDDCAALRLLSGNHDYVRLDEYPWARPKIKHEFTERTGEITWRPKVGAPLPTPASNSTAGVPSPRDTCSHAHPRSRRVKSGNRVGGQFRMRRSSTR